MKTGFRRTLFILYILLLVAGFLVQTVNISTDYFSFPVDTHISYHEKGKLKWRRNGHWLTIISLDLSRELALHSGFLWYRIFNAAKFNKDHNATIIIDFTSLEASWESARSLNDVLTLEQIMDYTPHVDEAREGCVLRQFAGKSYNNLNETEIRICKKYIMMDKYFLDNQIFYNASFAKSEVNVVSDSVIFDPNDSFLIQSIKFNKTLFGKAGIMTTFLAPKNATSILNEYRIAPRVDLGYVHSPKEPQKSKRVGVQHYEEVIQNLPWPYQTNCIEGFNQVDTISECVREDIWKNYHRLSPMTFYKSSHHRVSSMVSFESHINRSIGWNEITQECSAKYELMTECEYRVIHSGIGEMHDWNTLEVYMMPPKLKSSYLTTTPKHTVTSFITDLTSNAGTYFGFSFIIFLGVFGLYWKTKDKDNGLKLRGLKNRLSNHSSGIITLRNAFVMMWNRFRNLEQETANDKEQVQELLAKIQENLKRVEGENAQLRAQQLGLQQHIELDMDNMNEKILQIGDQVYRTENNVNGLHGEYESMRQTVIEMGDEQKSMKASISEATDIATNERAVLGEQVNSSLQTLIQVEKDQDEIKRELESMKQTAKDIDNELNLVKKSLLEAMELSKAEIREELNALMNTLLQLENGQAELKKEQELLEAAVVAATESAMKDRTEIREQLNGSLNILTQLKDGQARLEEGNELLWQVARKVEREQEHGREARTRIQERLAQVRIRLTVIAFDLRQLTEQHEYSEERNVKEFQEIKDHLSRQVSHRR